jgi:hypothetical protein
MRIGRWGRCGARAIVGLGGRGRWREKGQAREEEGGHGGVIGVGGIKRAAGKVRVRGQMAQLCQFLSSPWKQQPSVL